MCNYFLLICSDTEKVEGEESAYNITRNRLDKGLWPIYKGTRNRRVIHEGDKCLFYLAGRKEYAQHVIASGDVKSIEKWDIRKGAIDNEDVLSNIPEQVLHIINVEIFDPIPIRSLLNRLSFINKNQPHGWGGALQGGCKKINYHDYKLLLAKK